MNQPENYTLLWAFSTCRLRRGMNPPAIPTRPDFIRPARLSEAPFRVAGIVWITRQLIAERNQQHRIRPSKRNIIRQRCRLGPGYRYKAPGEIWQGFRPFDDQYRVCDL